MPVLLKENDNLFSRSSADVENLVTDVRDRLCLQSQDMFFQYEYEQRFRNSMTDTDFNATASALCQSDGDKNNSIASSKDNKFSFHKTKAIKDVISKFPKKRSFLHVPYNKKTYCDRNRGVDLSVNPKNKLNLEDPHLLLKKLISEQSLIQEAVRRLNYQRSETKFQDVAVEGLGFHSSNSNSSSLQSIEFEDPSFSEHSSLILHL